MSRVPKAQGGLAPPAEVMTNILVRYMERNREFYAEEFREAILE
jgi:hypothetical protein